MTADRGAEPPEPELAPEPGVPAPTVDAEAPPITRREIIARQARQRRLNRPYLIAGLLVVAGIMIIPTVAFILKFVLPPRELAVRVEDAVYTRGDVVDFIRFHQRLTEESGQKFQLGSSLFEALQTISENEIAFQQAPSLAVSVTDEDVDERIRLLLGFPGLSAEEANLPSVRKQLDEKLFEFLNAGGLSRDTYRNIVKKDLFRERVRERLAEDVPRIQPQVHYYRIVIDPAHREVTRRIDQRLKAGEDITALALEYSSDPDIKRNRGDEGWVPKGVVPQFDPLLFGVDQDGNRNLDLRQISKPVHIPDVSGLGVIYVAEYAKAREIDDAPYEILKDNALSEWLNRERKKLDVELVLNDRVYSWVNQQVRIASILPTPTAVPSDQFQVGPGGQLVPAQGG